MDIKEDVKKIIFSRDNFPRMIKKEEGELLKNYFDLDENFRGRSEEKTNLERRYIRIIGENKYSLLEEFLFRENEAAIEMNKAIGVNYYLSRKSLDKN